MINMIEAQKFINRILKLSNSSDIKHIRMIKPSNRSKCYKKVNVVFNPNLVRAKSIEHLRCSFGVTHVSNFSTSWLRDVDSLLNLSREVELSIFNETVVVESFIICFWIEVQVNI